MVVGAFVVDMVAEMDKFPCAGETVIGKDMKTFLGGKGANQCVAVRRLGRDVGMIGCVGNDANGKAFLDLFQNEGIDVSNIKVTDNSITGVAQIQIDNQGQNRICVIPCANHFYTLEDINSFENAIKDASIIIFQLEMRLDFTFEAIKAAKRANKTIILNPAPAATLPDDILASIDYLTPNETELALLSGIETDNIDGITTASKKLLRKGVKNVVVTLGSKGSLIANSEGVFTVSGYKVKAIDTVAAGDGFNGALAVQLLKNQSLIQAVKYANAMGALTVTKKGAIPSLHTYKEVEDFILKNS